MKEKKILNALREAGLRRFEAPVSCAGGISGRRFDLDMSWREEAKVFRKVTPSFSWPAETMGNTDRYISLCRVSAVDWVLYPVHERADQTGANMWRALH